MNRREILVDLGLAVGVFTVAYLLFAVGSSSGSAVSGMVGGLPAPVQFVLLWLGVIVAGAVGVWLTLKLGIGLVKAFTSFSASNFTSGTVMVFAVAGGVLLAGFLLAGLALSGGAGTLWDNGPAVTGLADEAWGNEGESLDNDEGLSGETNDAYDGEGSLWEGDGVTGDADDALNGEEGPELSLEGGKTLNTDLTDANARCDPPSGTDSDGDRLPDQWEENGETPGGAPLPDADPQSKDIYIQLIYSENADRITDTEKKQLKEEMASWNVTNPSGENGIDVHFIDHAPNDGRVDESISTTGHLADIRTQYYNDRYLGEGGVCNYHLMAVGSVGGSADGYGEVPGYVTIIESDEMSRWSGEVKYRTAVMIHELLHNVVGQIGVGHHTDTGWLHSPFTPEDTYLSAETREQLNDGLEP